MLTIHGCVNYRQLKNVTLDILSNTKYTTIYKTRASVQILTKVLTMGCQEICLCPFDPPPKFRRPLWWTLMAILLIDLAFSTYFMCLYGARAYRFIDGKPDGEYQKVSYTGTNYTSRVGGRSWTPTDHSTFHRRFYSHQVAGGRADGPYRPDDKNYDVNQDWDRQWHYWKVATEGPGFIFMTTLFNIVTMNIAVAIFIIYLLISPTIWGMGFMSAYVLELLRIFLIVSRYIAIDSTFEER